MLQTTMDLVRRQQQRQDESKSTSTSVIRLKKKRDDSAPALQRLSMSMIATPVETRLQVDDSKFKTSSIVQRAKDLAVQDIIKKKNLKSQLQIANVARA